MFYIIDEQSLNPYHNLAAEQYIFDCLDRRHDYLYLWQNDRTVVVGRYQNTYAEVNLPLARDLDIRVVRRLSGGGAVYHDRNNLNYSIITDAGDGQIRFRRFLEPVADLLRRLGAPVEIGGRNDLLLDGGKCSGNAQYMKQGRVLHHGTLLFDCDPLQMAQLLLVSDAKYEGRAQTSVRSRVRSLRNYLPQGYTIQNFRQDLAAELARSFTENSASSPSPDCNDRSTGIPRPSIHLDQAAILALQRSRYETWEWNYGTSPAFTLTKTAYLDGVGTLTIQMNAAEGYISDIRFTGDFFSSGDPGQLEKILRGCPLRMKNLLARLTSADVSGSISGLCAEALARLLPTEES